MELKGSVAIVTGGSRGIGRSIAESLAKAGAHVVLAARNADALAQASAACSAFGVAALAVPTDVRKEDDVRALVDRTLNEFGRIDVLVNNAGYGVFSRVLEMRTEDFDGMWNVNMRGTFLCTKGVLPTMIGQRRGAIINIASLAGKNAFTGGAGYGATKWALLGFSRSLMLEVREYSIRVVTLCPGSVNTDFSDHRGDGGLIIQPQDVADAVLFALTMPDRTNVSEIDIRPTIAPR